MTTPARMRPAASRGPRVADLVSTFALVTRGLPLPADAVLTGVTLASGDVEPGDVFVAVTGFRVHGATYAAQAVDAGAVAVLTDEAGLAHLDAAGLTDRVAVLVADDPRAIAGPVAAWAHDAPGRAARRRSASRAPTARPRPRTSSTPRCAPRTRRPPCSARSSCGSATDAVESPRTTVEAPALQAILALAARARRDRAGRWRSRRTRSRSAGCAGSSSTSSASPTCSATTSTSTATWRATSATSRGCSRPGRRAAASSWSTTSGAAGSPPSRRSRSRRVATHVGAPEGADADWAVVAADIGLDGVGSSFTLRGPDGVEHDGREPAARPGQRLQRRARDRRSRTRAGRGPRRGDRRGGRRARDPGPHGARHRARRRLPARASSTTRTRPTRSSWRSRRCARSRPAGS